MGLIDRDAIVLLLRKEHCDCELMPLLIEVASEIDSIHYAGGCYCRECEHWHLDDDIGCCGNPDGLDNYAKPDDFCSYGCRKA